MPSDIRSFFGGKAGPAPVKEEKKAAPKKAKSRKIVEDSDDEEEEVKPKKTTRAAAKKAPSPEVQETTTAAYFATKGKPQRSEATKVKASPATSTRSAKPTKSYAEDLNEDDFPDDDLDADDTPLPVEKKKTVLDLDHDHVPAPRRRSAGKAKPTKIKDEDDDFEEDVDMKDTNADDAFVIPDDDDDDDDDDEMIVEDLPAPKTKAKPKPRAGAKRKSKDLDDEDEEEEEEEKPKPKKARATATTKKAAPKKTKETPKDSADIAAILNDIPLVRAPTPPAADADKPKFQFGQHSNSGPAPEAGTLEIPEGEENCLAGMTFVFTGQLKYIAREDGQNLVKKYGGKVTTGPSKNTTFVVIGDDAGPAKLKKIADLSIKTIDEHGLFALIQRLPANGGDGKAAAQAVAKKESEAKKIAENAAKMEEEERAAAAAAAAKGASRGKAAAGVTPDGPDNRLWTVKYAPISVGQICGNKVQVEKLQNWLRAFPKNQRTKFKLPGKDGMGTYKAVMIHGPPGIGKTTAAHLAAKLEGYDIVESNASDTRSKKLVESGLKGVLSTTSLNGYFAGTGVQVDESKKKLVLIMDEVDGMSAGDRGGVGALAAVCKKSHIPMILICNDRKQPKMKPFDFVTFDLPFRRPTTDMIRSRIATIIHREKLDMPANVINALIEGTGADIRQIINMISTAKLDQTAMDFNQGKEMSKAWEKHVVLKPWDIISKILGGGLFTPASKATLNDKIELYFNDHDFSPLMMQENYLGTNPIAANGAGNARETNLKKLELASKAADSISDGDLVDRMIHGSQQQWSLMPAHAVFSFVRPASFMAGSLAGHSTRFTAWLGKNSNQGKLMRMVKEIQGHMRLRTSGDRHEIRQQYMPMLWQNTVKKLQVEGKEAVPEVIELMDQYYLTRDDFDAIMELGVGEMDMEKVKLETQTKSSFTRIYNQASHPLPFIKSSTVVGPTKKQAKDKPDLEEAMDDSDVEELAVKDEEDDDGGKVEEELDLSKDKYVKQPKKKAAPKAKAGAAAKGKGKKKVVEDDDDEEEEEEEEKPKKKRAPAKAKAKK